MPIYNPNEYTVENFNKELERGDLLIQFNIIFPKYIDEDKKAELNEILEECYLRD